MLKYKFQIFDENGKEMLELSSNIITPLEVKTDYKGEPEIVFSTVTKSIKEWIEFMKEVK